jgi:hypothetical protein
MTDDVQIPLGAWDGKGWHCHAAGVAAARLTHLHVDNAAATSWTRDQAKCRIHWTGDTPPKAPEEAYATFVFEAKPSSRLSTPVVVAIVSVLGGLLGALINAQASACPDQLEGARQESEKLKKEGADVAGVRDFALTNLREVTRLCNAAGTTEPQP